MAQQLLFTAGRLPLHKFAAPRKWTNDDTFISFSFNMQVKANPLISSSSFNNTSITKAQISVTDGRLPVEKFAPSLWAANTVTSFSLDMQAQERYLKEIEELKDEVRNMLILREINKQNDMLILIDNLERLGVAYHFKQEIEHILQEILNSNSQDKDADQLFTTALRFRLLRQHRHHVSPKVFDRFKGEDGKFGERLSRDVEGLLSLFEAAHVRIHGEHILEEALAFTKHHLTLMAPELEGVLGDRVKRALEHPLHWSNRKVESRHYISFYERDNLHNEMLLKLAKLDFNYLQNIYKKELRDLSIWWDRCDLMSKLTYVRDRVVENHFGTVGMLYEPQYSFARSSSAKCVLITSILDDTYDNYATIQEAEAFTEALQRWDHNEIEKLPDYMKVVYEFILSTYEELESEASDCGRSFAAPYVREAIIELGQAYNTELKWFLGMETPTIEAYNSNLMISIATFTSFMPCLLGMESASVQVFEWLFGRPKLIAAIATFVRYVNHLYPHEREVRGAQMLTGISMHMKLHGVTEKEALKRFGELIEESQIDINTEFLKLSSTDVPLDVSNALYDFYCISGLFYKHSDGYSDPGKALAPEIAGLYLNPFII